MAVKNLNKKRRIAKNPCQWCGWQAARRDVAHIIDEKDWKNRKVRPDCVENLISLCPNCHHSFDEVVRPILHNALSKFGVTNLPHSWEKDNKISSESQKGKRA
jgi:predicted restriction endonuclease